MERARSALCTGQAQFRPITPEKHGARGTSVTKHSEGNKYFLLLYRSTGAINSISPIFVKLCSTATVITKMFIKFLS